MKKITLFCIAILLTGGLLGFRPAQAQVAYSRAQIEAFVREVFANQADALVLKSDSSRLQLITGFLNRVEILYQPELKGKKFKLLSSVKLQDKYNPGLLRDAVYNPATFNPLKYHFPMASQTKEVYRFDQTDYLIIIHPVK